MDDSFDLVDPWRERVAERDYRRQAERRDRFYTWGANIVAVGLVVAILLWLTFVA